MRDPWPAGLLESGAKARAHLLRKRQEGRRVGRPRWRGHRSREPCLLLAMTRDSARKVRVAVLVATLVAAIGACGNGPTSTAQSSQPARSPTSSLPAPGIGSRSDLQAPGHTARRRVTLLIRAGCGACSSPGEPDHQPLGRGRGLTVLAIGPDHLRGQPDHSMELDRPRTGRQPRATTGRSLIKRRRPRWQPARS
jgi:hypothetical protein